MKKTDIQIPGSLADMTLKQYQDIIKITQDNGTNERLIQKKIVQYFTGDDLDEVEDIGVAEYNLIINTITSCLREVPKHKSVIQIGDVSYGFIPKLGDMSAGEFIDLDAYIPDVQTWHKAMAVLYRPITEVKQMGWFKKKFFYDVAKYEKIDKYTGTSEHSDNMLNMSAADALGGALFFWTLSRQLLTASLSFIEKEMKKKRLSPQQKSLLESTTAGIKASMELLEVTYSNSMPFLNRTSSTS